MDSRSAKKSTKNKSRTGQGRKGCARQSRPPALAAEQKRRRPPNGAATNANKTRPANSRRCNPGIFRQRIRRGPRIDDIMRLSKVSKNLIYHYFGSKEKAVHRRSGAGLSRHAQAPDDVAAGRLIAGGRGFRKLVRVHVSNIGGILPEFIGLLNSENFHKGKHLRKSKTDESQLWWPAWQHRKSAERGAKKSGDFRSGVDSGSSSTSRSRRSPITICRTATRCPIFWIGSFSTEGEMKAWIVLI